MEIQTEITLRFLTSGNPNGWYDFCQLELFYSFHEHIFENWIVHFFTEFLYTVNNLKLCVDYIVPLKHVNMLIYFKSPENTFLSLVY